MDMVNGLPRIKVKLRIENKGESPAVNISYAVLLCVGYEPTIGYHINWSQYRKDYLGFVGDIFQGEATELDAEVHHDGKRLGCERGYLVATVFYKATFSDELRETSVFWKMWDNRSDEDLIDFGEPLSSKQLVLTPWNEMPGLIG